MPDVFFSIIKWEEKLLVHVVKCMLKISTKFFPCLNL